MRIWTLHPKYLDRQGLTAVWREGLLAQAVLLGKTKGYRQHPQLLRFKQFKSPAAAIGYYLLKVAEEAEQRGYNFNKQLVEKTPKKVVLRETQGQLLYEWQHLVAKVKKRSPEWYEARLAKSEQDEKKSRVDAHPIFQIISGEVQSWEKVKEPQATGKKRTVAKRKRESE